MQATSPIGFGTVRADRLPGVQVYGTGSAGLNGYLNATAGTITTINPVTGATVSTPTRRAFSATPNPPAHTW